MLPGSSGFRWMPRKMAGIAMITIEASIVAIVMLRVVLDRATHRYRSGRPSPVPPPAPVLPDVPFRCPYSTLRPTLTQSTPDHLLNVNYVSGPFQATISPPPPPPPPSSAGPAEAGVFSRM